jgi:hypothetical protein
VFVGGEERADDELAGLDGGDVVADLLDDADVLVPDRGGAVDLLDAAVGPQVRPAHAGRGEADDGVGGLNDLRVVAFLDADVPGGVEDSSSPDVSPGVGRNVSPVSKEDRPRTCCRYRLITNGRPK